MAREGPAVDQPGAASPSSIARNLLVLAAYAAAFAILRDFASLWGSDGRFSFWFPAAGLRFAMLWSFGPRWAPGLAVAELATYLLFDGRGMDSGHDPLTFAALALRPLLYGAVIAGCRAWVAPARADLGVEVGSMTTAAVAAPLVVAAVAVPLALARHAMFGSTTLAEEVRMAAIFALGDMTGILLLATPMIWVFGRRPPSMERLKSSPSTVAACVAVVIASWAMTALMAYAGLGMRLVPVMLGVVWVAMRGGQAASWAAVALAALMTLPLTAGHPGDPSRFATHLGLVAIAIIGGLVGTFSDGELALRSEIARRNRLLFQADRLRTLRAMSTAVIHEIGQPLSVIAIEARHLGKLATDRTAAADEVERSASLVEKRVAGLVELVGRLRRFGQSSHAAPALLDVEELVTEALKIVRLESAARQVEFDVSLAPGLRIEGEAVELQQALLNLMRNAAQRTTDGRVAVRAGLLDAATVHVDVENRSGPDAPRVDGMGVGLLVASSIIEASGGELSRLESGGLFRARATFPEARHA